MKVLFWTDGFWPRIGGIETQGLRFVEGMQQRGHQFLVLAQKDQTNWSEDEIYRGIPIRRFDFNAIISKTNLGLVRSIQEYLECIAKTFKPDIIHLNAGIGGSAFVFLLFRKIFRSPLILTSHAPYFLDGRLCSLVEKIAFSVDQICCVSKWVLNELETHLPMLKSKLKLIYNGLPMPEISPAPLVFSPPILLLFGRLSWEKGFDTAIEAFFLLKKSGSNASLIVSGTGPELPALKKMVAERDLINSVKFTGILSEEERLSTLNQASVVIVPSILESFGLVILESMQLQRPVIASNVQGIPEVVVDGETGILVPGKDPVALFHAIEDFLKNPSKGTEMGVKGRKRAIERFTLDDHLLQYEHSYNTLRRY